MTSLDKDRVVRYFVANTRDLTPAPTRQTARVMYAQVSSDPEVMKCCGSVLSDAELQRADRFASENDKARFIQRRAFRRFCGTIAIGSSRPLSQIVFQETENGRPYLTALADTWFSFSSCRSGFLGAWSSTHGIGVDIETQTEKVEARELAQQFFSAAEVRIISQANGPERQRTFLQLWNLKEAALKSIGVGLPFGLENFQFELHPKPRVVHAPSGNSGQAQFDAHTIEGTGACAAVVIRNLNHKSPNQ